MVTPSNEGVSLILPMSWKQAQQEAAGHLPTHWLFFQKLFSSAAGLADQQKSVPTRWLFFSPNFLHRLIGAAHANSCSCWLPFQGLQERYYRDFPEPLLSLVLVPSFSQDSYQLIPVINTPLFWDSQWVYFPPVNPEHQIATFCESLLCAARSYVLPSILYHTLF